MSKTILVLAPHTDDCELGMGATMAHHIASGYRLVYVCFSTCEESVPEGFPKTVLKEECLKSNKVLGISRDDVVFLDFRVRRFNERRQDILEKLIEFRNSLNPVIVYAPSSSDIHQDHQTVHNEAKRAFKNSTLLCYSLPWNDLSSSYRLIKEVSEECVQKKIKALAAYKSQSKRSYFKADFIESFMYSNGVIHGKKHVELFEVVRLYD
jgi:LmbE family N-acetylglucosaminyl deacetylase